MSARIENKQTNKHTHLPKGTKVLSDFFFWGVWRETTNKDLLHRLLPLHGFGFFRVNYFPIEFMFLL